MKSRAAGGINSRVLNYTYNYTYKLHLISPRDKLNSLNSHAARPNMYGAREPRSRRRSGRARDRSITGRPPSHARSSPHPSALFRPGLSGSVPARFVPSNCSVVKLQNRLQRRQAAPGGGFDGTERTGTHSDGRKQGRNSADGFGEGQGFSQSGSRVTRSSDLTT